MHRFAKVEQKLDDVHVIFALNHSDPVPRLCDVQHWLLVIGDDSDFVKRRTLVDHIKWSFAWWIGSLVGLSLKGCVCGRIERKKEKEKKDTRLMRAGLWISSSAISIGGVFPYFGPAERHEVLSRTAPVDFSRCRPGSTVFVFLNFLFPGAWERSQKGSEHTIVIVSNSLIGSVGSFCCWFSNDCAMEFVRCTVSPEPGTTEERNGEKEQSRDTGVYRGQFNILLGLGHFVEAWNQTIFF